ncbi:unnamed protein product [Rotaria sp. Silwood2]|nr:unnamed protein product [Rotaria sp. Silwood2]
MLGQHSQEKLCLGNLDRCEEYMTSMDEEILLLPVINLREESFESHQLIWLDDDTSSICTGKLRSIIDQSRIFNNIDECMQHLKTTENRVKFLVSSEKFSEKIVPLVHNYQHLRSIFIRCHNEKENEQMPLKYEKVIGCYGTVKNLLTALIKNIQDFRRHCSSEEHIFEIPHKVDQTTDETISWWSQFIDFLARVVQYPINCKHRLVNALNTYYNGNVDRMRIIQEFDETYTPETAIRWYTRQTFFFSLLNTALRQQNIPWIFLFGFSLKDVYEQLKQKHTEYLKQQNRVLKVYRGQIISKKEVLQLKRNRKCLVPTNAFLSTTVSREIAKIFIQPTQPEDEFQSILFEIELSFEPTSQLFGDISSLSTFQDEEEFLFMAGSEFEVKDKGVRFEESEQLWIIKLIESNYIDKDRETVFLHPSGVNLKREIRKSLTFLNYTTEDNINLIFTNLLLLYPSESWLLAIRYEYLAKCTPFSMKSQSTLVYCNKALEHWRNYLHHSCQSWCELEIGEVYRIIAIHYLNNNNKILADENYTLAITYYNKAIENVLQNDDYMEQMLFIKFDKTFRKCASLYIDEKIDMTDDVHEKMNYRRIALTYRQRELQMRKTFPCLESDELTIICYNAIGQLHEELLNYNDAIKNYQEALELFMIHPKPYYLWIINIAESLIRILMEEIGDYDAALQYALLVHEYKSLYWTSAIDEFNDGQIDIAKTHIKLSTIYEKLLKYELAYHNLLIASKLYTSSNRTYSYSEVKPVYTKIEIFEQMLGKKDK